MNLLALDCSFSGTGWASLVDGEVASGVRAFPSQKGEAPALRFVAFSLWLERVLARGQFGFCAYERPHFRGYGPTVALCGLVSRVEELCARYDVPVASLHSGTLKKHATGKGNAGKPEMKAAALRLYSHYNPASDKGSDEADALLLLDYLQKRGGI